VRERESESKRERERQSKRKKERQSKRKEERDFIDFTYPSGSTNKEREQLPSGRIYKFLSRGSSYPCSFRSHSNRVFLYSGDEGGKGRLNLKMTLIYFNRFPPTPSPSFLIINYNPISRYVSYTIERDIIIYIKRRKERRSILILILLAYLETTIVKSG
jgi:hypothetical protein